MPTVLITGATGFVGKVLSRRMTDEGWRVRATLLPGEDASCLPDACEPVAIEPLGPATPLHHALDGVDAIVHLAARVHVMRETAADPLREFRLVNTEGTANLARQAAVAGVKRFVFMSTIGVNGDNSGAAAYTEHDTPAPHNDYSVSKLEAEIALHEVASAGGMEVVCVRAPLVYGPGNPGNFLTLLKIVDRGLPLPFALVRNRRSFLYVENLVEALALCAVHPAAVGKTYLLSDGKDLSTPELIGRIAASMGRTGRLLPVPASVLLLAGNIAGKGAAVNRLLGSLTVDSSAIRRELGWVPPVTVEAGLHKTVEWFMKSKQ